jgi:MSHA biogenesis protein MshO
VELIVSLTVTAIVATFSVTLLSAPPLALDAGARRTALTDSGSSAIDQIGREWQTALPNSLRFRNAAGVLAIEYLAVLDATTLFQDIPAVPAAQRLSLGSVDTQFETIGAFAQLTKPFDSARVFVALHSSGTAGANAYALSNVISPPGTRVRVTASSTLGRDRVTLTPGVTFTRIGARRRVHVVSGPVSYLCDPRAGSLWRYSGYAIALNQTQRDSDAELLGAGAQRRLLANGVTACRIVATPTSAAGQVAHSLTVSFGSGRETLRLTAMRVGDNAG